MVATTEGPATEPQMSSSDNVNMVQQLINTGWGGWGERADIAKRFALGVGTSPGLLGQATMAGKYIMDGVPVGEPATDAERMNIMGISALAGGAPGAGVARSLTEPGRGEPTTEGTTTLSGSRTADPKMLEDQSRAAGLTIAGVLAEDKAEWDTAISEAIADQNSALNDKFGDVIDRLKSDLHDFQRGKIKINELYASYTDASNKIMSQAVVDAEGLDPTEVVAEVGRSYDNAEGALNEALIRIDTSENPGMAKAMNAELRMFEGSIESALQSDINMQDALHNASSDYAEAVSRAAWSGDIYNAERSRAEIQIQLNNEIAEQQEEIARQNASWAKSKKQAEDQAKEMYGEEWDPDRDVIWDASFESYLEDQGFNSEMIREMKLTYPQLKEKGANIATIEGWYRLVQQEVNEKNLAALQLPDGRTALDLWQGTYGAAMENPDRSLAVAMNQLIGNLDFADAHQTAQTMFDSVFGAGQFEIPFSELGDNAASTHDDFFQALQRTWKWDRDFSEQYDTELEKAGA